MREIHIPGGFVALVDNEDYAMVTRHKWHIQNGRPRRTVWKDGKSYGVFMHQEIIGKVEGMCIDHIDGNPLNNTRSNLRHVTNRQNAQNSRLRVTSTSGFKGVTSVRGRYQARIRVDGILKHLGTFNDAVMAHCAYADAAIKYFGQYARIK